MMVTSFFEHRWGDDTQLTEAMATDDLWLVYFLASSAHTGASDWQNEHLNSNHSLPWQQGWKVIELMQKIV